MKLPKLAAVIPCLNEEACIENTAERLLNVINSLISSEKISQESFLYFIDDGSTDKTWDLISNLHVSNPEKIKGIKFSRNFGHQNALTAGIIEGLKYGADCFISIDADLQQDETKMHEFLEKYRAGAEIVCGVRNNRNTDGIIKKCTALAFYKLMNLMGAGIGVNQADYRLIGKRAALALKQFPEKNLFLRGIVNELGFKKDYVYFDVRPRESGCTKYTFRKMLKLAAAGITSFSTAPLRFVSYTGFIMAFVSFIIGLSACWDKIVNHNTVPGWATLAACAGFTGGIQILCTGIIGGYLGQLFQEVKARPRYIIEQEIS